jgi:hypothetical protein
VKTCRNIGVIGNTEKNNIGMAATQYKTKQLVLVYGN